MPSTRPAPRTTARAARAFTLVDMLVGLTIVGVLTGLTVAGLAASRNNAADQRLDVDLLSLDTQVRAAVAPLIAATASQTSPADQTDRNLAIAQTISSYADAHPDTTVAIRYLNATTDTDGDGNGDQEQADAGDFDAADGQVVGIDLTRDGRCRTLLIGTDGTIGVTHPCDDVTLPTSPVDQQDPDAPGSATGQPGNAAVQVTFSPATATDVIRYQVQVAADGADLADPASWTATAQVPAAAAGQPVTVTGLDNGTSYRARVIAIDTFGRTSTPADVAGLLTPTAARPATPTGLLAAPTDGQVRLTWDAVATADIVDYEIGRRDPASSDGYSHAAAVPHTATEWTDSSVVNDTTYEYAIRARRPGAPATDPATDTTTGTPTVSLWSAVVLATPAGNPTGTGPATITWTSPSTGSSLTGTATLSGQVGAAIPVGATVTITASPGGTIGTATVTTDRTWALVIDTSDLSDGPVVLTATTANPAGGTLTDDLNVTSHNGNPTVTITSHTDGDTIIATDPLTVTATATDHRGDPVADVDMYLNGQLVGTDSHDGDDTYSVTAADLTTFDISHGDTVAIDVVATDTQGKTAGDTVDVDASLGVELIWVQPTDPDELIDHIDGKPFTLAVDVTSEGDPVNTVEFFAIYQQRGSGPDAVRRHEVPLGAATQVLAVSPDRWEATVTAPVMHLSNPQPPEFTRLDLIARATTDSGGTGEAALEGCIVCTTPTDGFLQVAADTAASGAHALGSDVAATDDWVAVAATTANSGRGEVRLYARTDTGWAHHQTLTSPAPTTNGHFGFAIDILDTTLVVTERDGRRIHLYTVDRGDNDTIADDVWQLRDTETFTSRTVTHPDGDTVTASSDFGYDVALGRGMVYVSDPRGSTSNNGALNSTTIAHGAVYGIRILYMSQPGALLHSVTAIAPPRNGVGADNAWRDLNTRFGHSIDAIQDGPTGDRLLVGAPGTLDDDHGRVYLYRRATEGAVTDNTPNATFLGLDGTEIGTRVAVWNGAVAWQGGMTGNTHLYVDPEDDDTYTQHVVSGQYGESLAFDAATGDVVIGKPAPAGQTPQTGQVVIWERQNDHSWDQDAGAGPDVTYTVVPDGTVAGQEVGAAVAAHDGLLVIGASPRSADSAPDGAWIYRYQLACPIVAAFTTPVDGDAVYATGTHDATVTVTRSPDTPTVTIDHDGTPLPAPAVAGADHTSSYSPALGPNRLTGTVTAGVWTVDVRTTVTGVNAPDVTWTSPAGEDILTGPVNLTVAIDTTGTPGVTDVTFREQTTDTTIGTPDSGDTLPQPADSTGTYTLTVDLADHDLHGQLELAARITDDNGLTFDVVLPCVACTDGPATNPDAVALGRAVATDGDWLAVGDSDGSAVQVHRWTSAGWRPTQLLTSPAGPSDGFGAAIAIDATAGHLLIGAYADDHAGTDAGTVWAYQLQHGQWTAPARIDAPDAAAGDLYGFAVDVTGSRLAVGAYRADDPDDGNPTNDDNRGATYTYTWDGTGWTDPVKVTASNAHDGDLFGSAVALDGDTLAVGAFFDDDAASYAGAIYTYRWDGAGWTDEQQLPTEAASLRFAGYSLSLDGDRLVAGAYGDTSYTGAVDTYTRAAGTWTRHSELVASDRATNDRFGISVHLSGDALIVGATQAGGGTGAAYTYRWDGAGWTDEQRLAGATAGDQTGRAVAITTVGPAVGAPDAGTAGVVHTYTDNAGSWTAGQPLTPQLPDRCPLAIWFLDPPADGYVTANAATDVHLAVDTGPWTVDTVTITHAANPPQAAVDNGDGTWTAGPITPPAGTTSLTATITTTDGPDRTITTGVTGLLAPTITWTSPQPRAVLTDPTTLTVDVTAAPSADIIDVAFTDQATGTTIGRDTHTVTAGDTGTYTTGLTPDSLPAGITTLIATATTADGFTYQQPLECMICHGPQPAGDDDDRFGDAVDVHGQWMAVGAPHRPQAGSDDIGVVYLYRATVDGWALTQVLEDPAAQDNAGFGSAVAIHTDTLVVGAPSHDDGGIDRGAAYIYTLANGRFTGPQTLTGDGTADQFGRAVDTDGTVVAIGAPNRNSSRGAVYTYTRTAGTWTNQRQVTAADSQPNDLFGAAVAVDAGRLVAGAPYHDAGAADAGAIYTATDTGSAWTAPAKQQALSRAANDWYGAAVALHGDRLAVGSPLDDTGRGTDSGSVTTYRWNASSWTGAQLLTPATIGTDHRYGAAVAITDTQLITTATGDPTNGSSAGAIYRHTRNATWTAGTRMVASDGTTLDLYGVDVATDGTTLAVGASGDGPTAASDRGSTYTYTATADSWTGEQKLQAATTGDCPLTVTFTDPVHRQRVEADTAQGVHVAVDTGPFTLDTLTVDHNGVGQPPAADNGNGTHTTTFTPTMGDNTLTGTVTTTDGWTVQTTAVPVGAGPPEATWTQPASPTVMQQGTTTFAVTVADNGTPVDRVEFLALPASGGTTILGSDPTPAAGSYEVTYDTASLPVDDVQFIARTIAVDGTTYDTPIDCVVCRTAQQALTADEEFGQVIDIDGDRMVVGITRFPAGAVTGRAYIYRHQAGQWLHEATLQHPGPADDLYGSAVAISGDRVVIGAPGEDVDGHTDRGAAYIYTRTGDQWTQTDRLAYPDADNTQFGRAVDIDADRVVITQSVDADTDAARIVTTQPTVGDVDGHVVVFDHDGAAWQPTAHLHDTDDRDTDGLPDSGNAPSDVVVTGDLVLTSDGTIHQLVNGTWTQTGQAREPDTGDLWAIAADTGRIAVALDTDTDYRPDTVQVWETPNGVWEPVATISQPTGNDLDFGAELSLDGPRLAIGVENRAPSSRGGAHLFTRDSAGTWTQEASMAHTVDNQNDREHVVALHGDLLVVGAPDYDTASGTAYGYGAVFSYPRRANGTWPTAPGQTIRARTAGQCPVGATITTGQGRFTQPGPVPVTVDVNPGSHTATGATLTVDGGPATTLAEQPDGTWTGTVTLTAGSPTLHATVETDSGLTIPAEADVDVADTPTVHITSPTDGQSLSGTVTVTADATGGTSTISGITLATAQGPVATMTAVGPDTWEATVDIDALPNGHTALTAYATTGDGRTVTDTVDCLACGTADLDSAPDGRFGDVLATDGTTLLVAAPDWHDQRGAVYVYTRNGAIWQPQARLIGPTPAPDRRFGIGADVHDDRIVVTSWRLDDTGTGDAYHADMYTRTGTAWAHTHRWTVTANGLGGINDPFVPHVAFTDVAGPSPSFLVTQPHHPSHDAGGVLRYFEQPDGGWWRTNPDDGAQYNIGPDGLETVTRFGFDVAATDQWTAVGAPLGDYSHATSDDYGEVHVDPAPGVSGFFSYPDNPDAGPGDHRGTAVALEGNRLVVGAPDHTTGGRVYVWEHDGSTWQLTATLQGSDTAAGDRFGAHVALAGNRILIGAPGDDSGRGAAYIFERPSSTWVQRTKLVDSGGAAGDQAGSQVTLVGSHAFIAAPGADGDTGTVHRYTRSTSTSWPATAAQPHMSGMLPGC